MYKICVKGIAVLAVLLLISLISISSAAGPRAMPNLYTGQCGVELFVPAPGILSNDVKTTAPLRVLDPETISIDPKYGSIEVQADGSFVYDAPQNLPSGTYVYFYYKATDGKSVTNQAIVKIAVSCKCHGVAPDISIPQDTKITPKLLISEGAGCMGCRDVTPKFDLSEIPAQPVAGCYPYTVSCPGCQVVTGIVCFECGEDAQCNDNNPCTTDSCDLSTKPGKCVSEPIVCEDDGNACTINHRCEGGKCVSDTVSCIAMEGYKCCPDVGCVNTWRDPNNCGGCGVTCASGVCIAGKCDVQAAADCIASGGSIETQACCAGQSDFPNTCIAGACGCSPTSSKETRVCNCGEGMCFDGTTCKDVTVECYPVAEDIVVSEGTTLDELISTATSEFSCGGCNISPVIDFSGVTVNVADGKVTGGTITITCSVSKTVNVIIA